MSSAAHKNPPIAMGEIVVKTLDDARALLGRLMSGDAQALWGPREVTSFGVHDGRAYIGFGQHENPCCTPIVAPAAVVFLPALLREHPKPLERDLASWEGSVRDALREALDAFAETRGAEVCGAQHARDTYFAVVAQGSSGWRWEGHVSRLSFADLQSDAAAFAQAARKAALEHVPEPKGGEHLRERLALAEFQRGRMPDEPELAPDVQLKRTEADASPKRLQPGQLVLVTNAWECGDDVREHYEGAVATVLGDGLSKSFREVVVPGHRKQGIGVENLEPLPESVPKGYTFRAVSPTEVSVAWKGAEGFHGEYVLCGDREPRRAGRLAQPEHRQAFLWARRILAWQAPRSLPESVPSDERTPLPEGWKWDPDYLCCADGPGQPLLWLMIHTNGSIKRGSGWRSFDGDPAPAARAVRDEARRLGIELNSSAREFFGEAGGEGSPGMTYTERISYADGTTPVDHGAEDMSCRLSPRQRLAVFRGVSGHYSTSRVLWRRWLIEQLPRWSPEFDRFEDLSFTPFGLEVQGLIRGRGA